MSNVTDIVKETPEQPDVQETAVAPQEAQPMAVATGQVGEVDARMIKLPYINISANTGELGEEFGPGKLIYNQMTVLGEETDPQFTILSNRVGWQENLKFGESSDLPRTWDSREAAMADGMTQFEYGPNSEPPHVLPYCQATGVLSTKSDEGGFREGPDGRYYAAACWFFARSAFSNAGRRIVTTFAQMGRDGDTAVFPWAVSIKDKKNKGNKYFVPSVRPLPHHEEDVYKFIKNFLNSSN